MFIAHTKAKLHEELDLLRTRGGVRSTVALVVCRGNFHDGHGAVMNVANTLADLLVVAALPSDDQQDDNVVSSTEFRDIGFVEKHSADIFYLPNVPSGPYPEISLPGVPEQYRISNELLNNYLCLINDVQPDFMIWGERNFIEFHQVQSLVAAIRVRTQLQCIPTVRHANGAAVTRRDEVWTDQQRESLALIFQTLKDTGDAIRADTNNVEHAAGTGRMVLNKAGLSVTEFAVLDQQDLTPATVKTKSFRIMATVSLDGEEFTDNIGINL